ncbi:hypothetical protein [Streptomyces mirabilis]
MNKVSAAADLLVDIGPCDDDAYLFLNGRLIVQTRLGEVRRFQREMPDGSYNFRLQVINSGGWAWRAKLILTINGTTLTDVNEVGGSGFYTGEVYEQEWQCRIEGGKLVDF